MRRVSFNKRLAQDAESSAEVEVVLFEISHPALPAPIRLSTDPTERISTDPLVYGTRSSWGGANPATQPFLWILASALLPSDLEDAPAEGRIALETLDQGTVTLLRSFTSPAALHLAVVLASSPDLVEAEWRDLEIKSAEIDAGEIVLAFSREPVEMDHFPALRFSRDRFPGIM